MVIDNLSIFVLVQCTCMTRDKFYNLYMFNQFLKNFQLCKNLKIQGVCISFYDYYNNNIILQYFMLYYSKLICTIHCELSRLILIIKNMQVIVCLLRL